ncbi:hypothetical protein [Streptomyces sp. NBC_01614]
MAEERLHQEHDYDEATQKYVERRTSEGKSKMESLIRQDSTPNRSVQRG